ncbi:Polycystic kidney disease protein 1-like 3 [Sesbania bispinosa]|nr:Polycystic kidney disease protein 1-like 3 [Sesbania bispinosa]
MGGRGGLENQKLVFFGRGAYFVGILTCQSILVDTSRPLNERLGDIPISNQNKLQLKREKKVVAALQVIPTKLPTASDEIKASPSIEAPLKKQKIEDKKSSNGSKGSKQTGLSDGGKAAAEFLFSGKSSLVGPYVDEKIAQSVLSEECW